MEQLQQIERYMLDGEGEALEQLLNQLKTSTDLDLLYETANLLVAYGFMDKANLIYLTLLEHLPDEAQLKIDRASTLMELGEEDEALLLLTEVNKNDEEYVQALLLLADYYQMTGLTETALDKIQEAYELLPNEPVIRFAYAELLFDTGKLGEAARLYVELNNEVKEIGDVQIIARLAETYSAGAAYEEAIPYYEELLQEKALPDTLFGAAFAYYQTANAERAISLLDELIDADPDYFSAYMLSGQAKILAGADQEAYEMFLEGIKREEFNKELQLSAGKCALKLGHVEVAETHLKEALALDPEYIEAMVTLASLYNEKELDEKIFDLLLNEELIVEDTPILRAFIAYAYERTEQFEKASDFFQEAYTGMNDNYEFLSKYANFLVEEGNHQKAVEVVTQLLEFYPDEEHWRTFLETHNNEGV